jgi:eukaryotic-like serine/threonine-protein kinase
MAGNPSDPADPLAATSLGEAAAIGRIAKALFGGDERPVQVGRYAIQELIGSGAFGKVYRAHDPELRRDVALKILDAQADADREELLSEARVMAALGHPNVVAVHDAGVIEHADKRRVFIAMELVAGGNLRAWLSTARPAAQIVAVMRDVGRGLAAAHAAGIVHRDLKPENILVGGDGRPRVVDFGLARAHADVAASDAGTPAYMAPEQLAGGVATAASDQFAFCVTAWEALHGERPFPARSIDELRAAHARPLPAPGRTVDNRVTRALARGLASDPAARFPSMDALLGELAPRRKTWPLVAALAVVAGGGVAIGVVATHHDAGDPCPPATSELAGVWDPARRAAVESAFRATKLPYAADSFAHTAAALDRAAESWLAAHHDACVATAVRHEQSAELLDRRVACLADWKRQLRALADTCAAPTPEVVQNAVRAVAALPSLAYCADRDALAAGPPRPKDAHTDQLYDQLAKARGLALSGPDGVTKAFQLADGIARDPAAAKYPPLAIAVAQWQARALTTQNRYDEASAAARRGFDLALAANDRRAQAEAAIGVAALGMSDASKKDEALRWLTSARSIADKLGADDLRARIAFAEGSIRLNGGDPDAAEAALRRAIEAYRTSDPKHPDLAGALTTLGMSELQRGKVEPATEHLRDGLARTEANVGKDHPAVATALVNLAFAETAGGHFVDAIALDDRAIPILERTYGATHPTLISMHGSRAQNAAMRGDRAGAVRAYGQAIAIAEANFGADNPMIVPIRLFQADFMPAAEGLAIATKLRAGMDGSEDTGGDLGLAFADTVIAHGLAATGKRAEALARARGAAKRCEAHPDPEPLGPCPMVFQTVGDLARDPAALEHAQALLLATPDPLRLAQVRLSLATLKHDPALAALALQSFPRDGDPAIRNQLAALAK